MHVFHHKNWFIKNNPGNCATDVSTENNRDFLSFDWWINRLLTDFKLTFFSKIKKMQKLFSKFFRFFYSTINRNSTEFFFKNKKIAKIIFKIFFEFFFSKNFFYENFFLQIFFWWKFILSNFFLAKIFLFTKIFLRRLFSQYFREFLWYLMFAKSCILRNFLFEILLIANVFVLQFWCTEKKIENFFCDFFSAMNVNTKFDNFSFLKKSKIFSDRTFGFFLLTIRKITMLRDEQRTRKIQNNMKSTTGYLEQKIICMHKGLSIHIT